MHKSLARRAAPITITSAELLPGLDAALMQSKTSRVRRKPAKSRPARKTRKAADAAVVPDGFYRDMVWNLRNGVIAITRDGRVAVMNDIAYRTLGLKPQPRTTDIGRHYSEVLKDVPEVCRMIASVFEISHLPNRAEMRLKGTEKVIGYTLSHVRDAHGESVGATLFFKELTRVEQLEER